MRKKWLQRKKEWKQIGVFDKLLWISFAWGAFCIFLFIFRGANITFNSDSAAANLLAREERITKQLLPDTWNYSTDLMVWFINIPIVFFQLFMKNEFLMRSIAVFLFVLVAIYSIYLSMNDIFGSRCYYIALIWIFIGFSITFQDMLIEQAAYIVSIINIFLCCYLFLSSVDKEFRIYNRKRFILLLFLNFMHGSFSILILQQVVLPIIGAIIIMIWYRNKEKNIWEIDYIKNKIKTIGVLLFVSAIALGYYSFIKRRMGYSGNANQMLAMKNCVEVVERFPIFLSGILSALGIGGNGSFLSLSGIKNILHIFLGICIIICPIFLLLKFKKEEFKVQFFIIYAYIHIFEVLIILIFGNGSDYIGIARYMLSSICLMIVMSSYFIYKYIISDVSLFNLTNILVGTLILLFVFINGEEKIRISIGEYEERYQSKYGIINFLKENDLIYGYASFWNAGIYSVASNFEVEIYPVVFYAKPEAYYWLTSDRGFEEENFDGNTFLMMTQEEYQLYIGENKYCYPILGEPKEILEYGSYVIQTYSYNICANNFSGDDRIPVLHMMIYSSERKKQENKTIVEPGQVLFGPYITLDKGSYTIEVETEQKENVNLLVTDQCGKNILFCFLLENGFNRFEFVFEEEKREVEFNITNSSASEIAIKEVTIIRENE